jgi:glycerophosphoryl diester phosphodiesterase
MLNLDIKEHGALDPAARALRAQGFEDRAFFSGLDLEGIRKAADSKVVRGIPYLFNADAFVSFPIDTPDADDLRHVQAERVCKLATDCGCSGINLEWTRADRAFVCRCQESGMRIMLWTVDDPVAMRSVLALGPDSITTNRPDLLFGLLEEESSSPIWRHRCTTI